MNGFSKRPILFWKNNGDLHSTKTIKKTDNNIGESNINRVKDIKKSSILIIFLNTTFKIHCQNIDLLY